MIIKSRAYPRAALIGNPSDGYFGKTIAFVLRNYCAEIELYETPELELLRRNAMKPFSTASSIWSKMSTSTVITAESAS